jgi:predicted nucleic-acid-binding Zn-ribbon protein
MKGTGKCPKCGGTDLIADAMVIGRGYEITIAKFQKPDALIFKGKESTTVSAWMCSTCGYIELYANDPEK